MFRLETIVTINGASYLLDRHESAQGAKQIVNTLGKARMVSGPDRGGLFNAVPWPYYPEVEVSIVDSQRVVLD